MLFETNWKLFNLFSSEKHSNIKINSIQSLCHIERNPIKCINAFEKYPQQVELGDENEELMKASRNQLESEYFLEDKQFSSFKSIQIISIPIF